MGLAKKLGIGGGALFVVGIGFGFIIFPPFLRSQIRGASKLKEGSDIKELWAVLPFPLTFKVYLFNVTNPREITQGEKPILREVGPFVYDEWKEKVDLKDYEDDDTIEYSQRTTWVYNKKKSKGLSEDEIITVPHMLILGVIMTTVRTQPARIGIASKAIDSIFKKPETIFVEASAHDILFGGLPIDCTVKDFAGAAVCSLLAENDGLVKDGENRYKFSLFGAKNGTIDDNRLRVKRGIKDVKEVGEVIEYKGEKQQTVWAEGTRCNVFNGTDGTIFRPFLNKEDDIVAFSPDICRSISSRWDGTHRTVGGLHTNHYTAEFGDTSSDPELKCFCESEDKCLKKGLYDLFNCVGVPMVGSLPHFYKVDESYLELVDGLSPSKKKHQIDLDFEPLTGSPVSARKRLQFNMFIHPVDKVKNMKLFPSALLPIFWVEESITLPDEFLSQLRLVFKMKTGVKIMKYLMMVVGIGLGGAAAFVEYRRRHGKTMLEVTKVPAPGSASRTDSGTEKKWPMNVMTLQAANVPPSLDRA